MHELAGFCNFAILLSDGLSRDRIGGPGCKQPADLYSVSKSPTGKFGSHATPCYGLHFQNDEWEDKCPVFFFDRLLRQSFEKDLRTSGQTKDDSELEATFEDPGLQRSSSHSRAIAVRWTRVEPPTCARGFVGRNLWHGAAYKPAQDI